MSVRSDLRNPCTASILSLGICSICADGSSGLGSEGSWVGSAWTTGGVGQPGVGTNIQPPLWAEPLNKGGDSRVGGGDQRPTWAQDVCSALSSWPAGWDGWAAASDVHRDDPTPSMYMPQSPSNASSSVKKQLYLLRRQGIQSENVLLSAA